MARKKTNFEESLITNSRTYGQYLMRLTELSLAMFEWKNVPDTIDPRFLELTLFEKGQAIFFEDEELGFLTLDCTWNGDFDVYRIPKKRRAYAVNGYQRNLDNHDSVIIWNNMIHTNSVLDVKQFAKRLYNLDRIIDVNANAQKTPVLLQGTETQRLTLLNLYKEFDGNSPVIFGDKNLDINSIRCITTNAPYVADKLYTLKTQIWNEALTYLGINNLNVAKKERMIVDEISRSQGGTIANRFSRLNCRKQACKEINKMFGLNMDCDFKNDPILLDEDNISKNYMEDLAEDE